jgi:ribonuclease HI
MTGRKKVTAWTDGACKGNPGVGGYGVVLLHGGHRRELSGGFRLTTNNRMELTAAVEALRILKEPCDVVLHTDSRYIADAMEKGWARRWRANGWKRNKKGDRAQNPDLWEELLELCDRHAVQFRWVEGHAGITENERCDELSNEAVLHPRLPADPGYRPGSP